MFEKQIRESFKVFNRSVLNIIADITYREATRWETPRSIITFISCNILETIISRYSYLLTYWTLIIYWEMFVDNRLMENSSCNTYYQWQFNFRSYNMLISDHYLLKQLCLVVG